jgi:hypothetical protein
MFSFSKIIISEIKFDFFLIGNLIQEIGCAGRDGLPAQSIIYYSARDFKTLYSILAGKCEMYNF